MEQKVSLSIFIKKAISEIENSLPKGYEIDDAIDFEMKVIHTKSKGGGLNLEVVSGKLDSENTIAHKINFSIINAVKKEADSKKVAEQLIDTINNGIIKIAKTAETLEQKKGKVLPPPK